MSKTPLSIEQQIDLLAQRGFAVGDDRPQLARFLYDNSYFRLSGCWSHFQLAPPSGDNTFTSRVTLASVRSLYEFDAALRGVLMQGLCDLEVALRGRLAYHLSIDGGGADAYLAPTTYLPLLYSDGTQMRATLIGDVRREISRSKEHFVAEFRHPADSVPVWVAMETVSFGTASKIYRLLGNQHVTKKIAGSFGIGEPRRLSSTLHSLSILRNVCAHHGRVWNRTVTVKPFVLKRLMPEADRRIYRGTPWSWMIVLADLVDGIHEHHGYSEELFALVDRNPEFRNGLRHPQGR